jgi:hypothetical protein
VLASPSARGVDQRPDEKKIRLRFGQLKGDSSCRDQSFSLSTSEDESAQRRQPISPANRNRHCGAGVEEHGLERRVGGMWSVSKVALAMSLDWDKKALQAYHSGDRTGAIVKAYFERGLVEMGRYQEQIQMIATAIGKPTANVLTNVRANSESKFGSGRVWSNDIWLAPSLQVEKGRAQTETQGLTIG